MIIGGHAMLGIEARNYSLQDEYDWSDGDLQGLAFDTDGRLLVVLMHGPDEGEAVGCGPQGGHRPDGSP